MVLTLKDFEQSEVGQQILAGKQAEAAAEAAEAKRAEDVAAWQAERDTLAGLYTTLRDTVLGKVEGLAGDTEELGKLLGRIQQLDSYLQKNGADVQPSVRLPEKRKLANQVRAIAQRLVARL